MCVVRAAALRRWAAGRGQERYAALQQGAAKLLPLLPLLPALEAGLKLAERDAHLAPL
jgi:hypothetical protein